MTRIYTLPKTSNWALLRAMTSRLFLPLQTAFKTLKPFPRRQDIVSKQTFYLNALKEKYRCRDLQRAAYAERDSLVGGLSAKLWSYGAEKRRNRNQSFYTFTISETNKFKK